MPTRRKSALFVLVSAILCCLLGGFQPLQGSRAQGTRFVFFEKFPANNPDQWTVQSLSDGSRTYLKGGTYQIVRIRPGTMRGWPLSVQVPAGFQFNVKLQILSGSDPYAGISFWDDLANSFMFFAIAPDGTAGLFKRTAKQYTTLVDWTPIPSMHKGIGAVNSLSVNLDPLSAALGRTLLVNGKPLGKPCSDRWRSALGKMPPIPAHGFHVGVVAGAFEHSNGVHVVVLRASMYDGTHDGPLPRCP